MMEGMKRLPVRTVQFRTLIWEDMEVYDAWKIFHTGKKTPKFWNPSES